MKINMVTPWKTVCGNAAYARGLVGFLKKAYDVRVVEVKKPYTWNPLPFYLLGKESSRNCDVVHVQHGYGVFGKLLFSGIHTPIFYLGLSRSRFVVTTLHDVGDYSTDGVSGAFRKVFRRLINHFIFTRSDILHVHSEVSKMRLISEGANEGKIVVSPLGIFVRRVPMNKEKCKKFLGLDGKKVVLLFGFVHANKGHDLVIEAIPKIGKDSVVFIAGKVKDAGFADSLRKRAGVLGVSDRLVFHGEFRDEEAPAILNSADVAVLPYRKITQSETLNSLLAYGIPSVTSSLPFFRDLESEYGCIKACSSVDEITAAVNSILHMGPGSRLKSNMERFVKERSPGNIVRDIGSMYESSNAQLR